jgi:hypothetical protein
MGYRSEHFIGYGVNLGTASEFSESLAALPGTGFATGLETLIRREMPRFRVAIAGDLRSESPQYVVVLGSTIGSVKTTAQEAVDAADELSEDEALILNVFLEQFGVTQEANWIEWDRVS